MQLFGEYEVLQKRSISKNQVMKFSSDGGTENRVPFTIRAALHGLVQFVKFKKREKYHGEVILQYSYRLKPATFLNVTLLHDFFQVFQILQKVPNAQSITYFSKKQILSIFSSYSALDVLHVAPKIKMNCLYCTVIRQKSLDSNITKFCCFGNRILKLCKIYP